MSYNGGIHGGRAAHYHRSIWEPDVIESLSTPYTVSPLLLSQTLPL
jgi:hypothetical protein